MSGIASWLLLVFYILLGLANIARGVLAFRVGPVLAPAAPSLDLSLLGGIYIVWGVALLGIGAGCARRRSSRARWTLFWAAVAYQLTGWIIRLVGDRSSYARSLWGRDLIVTLLFLGAIFVLSSLSASPSTDSKHLNRES